MHTALAYMPNVALAYMPDPEDGDEDAPPTQRPNMDLRAYARATEEATVIMPAAWLAQLRAQARGEIAAPKAARVIEVVELCAEDIIVESEVANRNHTRDDESSRADESDFEIDVMVDEMFDAMHA